jgi:hypothetical protein
LNGEIHNTSVTEATRITQFSWHYLTLVTLPIRCQVSAQDWLKISAGTLNYCFNVTTTLSGSKLRPFELPTRNS